MGPSFTNVGLQIISMLVSDGAKKCSNANREDVATSNGCIMLAQMLGCVSSSFTHNAACILSQTSKMPLAFTHIVHSGCVKSCLSFLRFLVHTGQARWIYSTTSKVASTEGLGGTYVRDSSSIDALKRAKVALFDVLQTLANLSVHAAGVHRARGDYDYVGVSTTMGEKVNYLHVLTHDVKFLTPTLLQTLLGLGTTSTPLLEQVLDLVRKANNLNVVRLGLRIACGMACSDCYKTTLEEVRTSKYK